jgi:hypothetical protein
MVRAGPDQAEDALWVTHLEAELDQRKTKVVKPGS